MQQKRMQQHELTEGNLLDVNGHLQEAGWARREMRRYHRAAIRAPWFRIKEWDYYCVLNGDYGLAVTIADNSYMGFVAASWLDFTKPRVRHREAMIPFPRGRMRLPESADRGDVVYEHPKISLAFRHEAGGRRLTVNAPSQNGRPGIKGEIFLSQAEMDRMVIATPFPNAPKAFYYNQKINCMPAEGKIETAGKTYEFTPDSAFGLLDWGRGVWTYDNTWYWGSASGMLDGHSFGFNIGYGFGDTSAASENMVFFDGVAHKLADIEFHMPEGTYDGAPWRFSSSDGRFEMDFQPVLDRSAAFDIKLLRSVQHQVFGRFTGFVILDDGRRLEVKEFFGFAEEVQNRW